MTAHVIAIDSKANSIGMVMHGWVCSCGRKSKRVSTEVRSARNGGARHVAAMERGK